MKKIQLQNINHDIKLAVHSALSVAKIYIHKFNVLANEDLESSFSKAFSQSANKLVKVINFTPNENNMSESINHLEEWLKVVSIELEVSILLYDIYY